MIAAHCFPEDLVFYLEWEKCERVWREEFLYGVLSRAERQQQSIEEQAINGEPRTRIRSSARSFIVYIASNDNRTIDCS
ncbi:hypothetical protein CgunFtcFv8_018161 [Champsocephalus gunnari]|uniref:Uncharacterized protein n=1 Tax=Champsocephalus gunnari TaxID=52237 RepID=A0AAN8DSC4_CHAGU|nr:hypothetical protein CgunFtcFv8_018161 [Champsocephalus gunnari]